MWEWKSMKPIAVLPRSDWREQNTTPPSRGIHKGYSGNEILYTKFNMPNLTSVERLSRFYEDDKNYFVVLFISYEAQSIGVIIKQVRFIPIEFLSWDCLTLGALGWGQIQIANSNTILAKPGYSRRAWMLELCDNLLDFYPREIYKINQRIDHFKKIKSLWESRPDE